MLLPIQRLQLRKAKLGGWHFYYVLHGGVGVAAQDGEFLTR